jgi:hypothetical protein
MIPRTFPSIIEAFQTKMVVYVLPSISGLKAWIDYIPVKGVVTEDPVLANTYANAGYQVVKSQESLTGQAWLDYIPVYEDASYNKPWSTDAGGYIPVGGLFSPATFFANGEQGWWYDPSNFATLFQDSAGTTPVTAMEQPVGLQLDLSKGLVLGPELANGSWTLSAGATQSPTGTFNFVGAGSSARLDNVLVVGKTYLISFSASGTGSLNIHVGDPAAGSIDATITTTGNYTFRLPCDSTDIDFQFRAASSGGFVGSVTNISVRELPGNHRFQTTSANRPVVSARVNLLTKTEEFDDAAWVKSGLQAFGSGSIVNATTAPDGTLTADFICENSLAGLHRLNNGTSVPYLAGTSLTSTIRVKSTTRNYSPYLGNASGAVTATFNLSSGTVSVAASNIGTASGATASITQDAQGFWLCTLSGVVSTSNSTNATVYHQIVNGTNTSYTGDGTSGIFIWGADLRPTNQGVNLPAYQRVNTSTDYDSTGFPIYIKPNGSNQFMQTNSINFTATDKMTVWQGVRKLSLATTGALVELGTNSESVNGSFGLFIPTGASQFSNLIQLRGTARAAITIPTTAPVTEVLSVAYDIGEADILDEIKPRINGAIPSPISTVVPGPAGTGNYGNYPAYFYARAGTSLPFNGHDYGSIARGAASTAAQIANGEAYINSKTKAYTP